MENSKSFPELRIVILGSVCSGKSSAGNIILGREEFELKRTAQCVKRQGEVAGRHITVVEAPGWWEDIPVEESPDLLKQEIVLSVSLCPPGPHAVLLVIPICHSYSHLFRETHKSILVDYVELLCENVWSYIIVLFTAGDLLGDQTIEQHIKNEGDALQWLIRKCGNRYHVLSNKNRGDDLQLTELVEKVEEMVAGHSGCCYEIESTILQEVQRRKRKEEEMAKERMTKAYRRMIRSHICDTHLSEVRIVLLGCRYAGKSSAGNTILGREEFELKRTAQCVKRQGEVAGRHITVVEAPGWWMNKPLHENTKLLKEEIVLSMSLCPPGPHAVLLVMRLDTMFKENERTILKGHLKHLGDEVWNHCILLFTVRDWLGNITTEQFIECEGKDLQMLVEKCGNRYHVLNNKDEGDDAQVMKLLEKIEELVAGNGGCCFEMERKKIQCVEEKRRKQKEIVETKMLKVKKEREDRKLWMRIRTVELRIVLLGYNNAGKSSSGNTILGREEFELKRTAQCVKRHGEVAGRNITVVEAPGWWLNQPVGESPESLKQEIVDSVCMCPPGPRAVLLVIRLDTVFQNNERTLLNGYMQLLPEVVWRYSMVLFTFGDWLGDTPPEQHIASEGEGLLWLVEKSGNRYHVFNNEDSSDDTQVKELLEKIEEMVAGNGRNKKSSDPQNLLFSSGTGSLRSLVEPRRGLPYNKPRKMLWRQSTKKLTTSALPARKVSYSLGDQHRSLDYGYFSTGAILFLPEKVVKFLDGKNSSSYRFLCPYAGQFQCRMTNLVFDMEAEGEVLYKIVSWDSRLLDGLGQMKPAGPLYDIECFEASVSHLHLPHCQILNEKNKVELVVAHFTGDNVELITPLKMTNTFESIAIKSLSLFGLLKSIIFYQIPINAQVLLFYKKTKHWEKRQKLHIHLLAANVPVEEVEKRHKGSTYFETSSMCRLTPGRKYRLSCKPYVPQPKVARFECDYGPNYHPTFVLFLKADNVTVSLLDEDDVEVWEPRQIFLPGHDPEADVPKRIKGAQFIDDHRETLIHRISSVMELADSLHSRKIISNEMYNNIHVAKTTQKQMRILYEILQSGGTAVKAEFYEILKVKRPFLVEELESEPIKA